MMLRQLHFSELDLVLHSRYRPQPGRTVFDSEEVKRVEARTTILKPLPEDRQAPLLLIQRAQPAWCPMDTPCMPAAFRMPHLGTNDPCAVAGISTPDITL